MFFFHSLPFRVPHFSLPPFESVSGPKLLSISSHTTRGGFFHVPCAVATELQKVPAHRAAQPCGLGGTSFEALWVFSNGRVRE